MTKHAFKTALALLLALALLCPLAACGGTDEPEQTTVTSQTTASTTQTTTVFTEETTTATTSAQATTESQTQTTTEPVPEGKVKQALSGLLNEAFSEVDAVLANRNLLTELDDVGSTVTMRGGFELGSENPGLAELLSDFELDITSVSLDGASEHHIDVNKLGYAGSAFGVILQRDTAGSFYASMPDYFKGALVLTADELENGAVGSFGETEQLALQAWSLVKQWLPRLVELIPDEYCTETGTAGSEIDTRLSAELGPEQLSSLLTTAVEELKKGEDFMRFARAYIIAGLTDYGMKPDDALVATMLSDFYSQLDAVAAAGDRSMNIVLLYSDGVLVSAELTCISTAESESQGDGLAITFSSEADSFAIDLKLVQEGQITSIHADGGAADSGSGYTSRVSFSFNVGDEAEPDGSFGVDALYTAMDGYTDVYATVEFGSGDMRLSFSTAVSCVVSDDVFTADVSLEGIRLTAGENDVLAGNVKLKITLLTDTAGLSLIPVPEETFTVEQLNADAELQRTVISGMLENPALAALLGLLSGQE